VRLAPHRSGTTRWLARPRLLCGVALAVAAGGPAGAEEPAQSGPAAPSVAAASSATTEALPLPAPQLKLFAPFTSGYWLREPDGLSAFRYAPELRLRLDVETYQARWGPLAMSTLFELAPPGEGSMPTQDPGASARASDTQGLLQATPALQLQLDVGDVGPVKRVGPFLRAGPAPGRPSTSKGFLRFGLGGKF